MTTQKTLEELGNDLEKLLEPEEDYDKIAEMLGEKDYIERMKEGEKNE
jgi:hypothetical protein